MRHQPASCYPRSQTLNFTPMRLVLLRSLCAALAVLLSFGCTITTEGVQNFEVPMEQILPPSRVVASYRQLNKPEAIKKEELEEQKCRVES